MSRTLTTSSGLHTAAVPIPMSAISKKGTWSRGNHIKYFVPSPVYRFTSGVNHWL